MNCMHGPLHEAVLHRDSLDKFLSNCFAEGHIRSNMSSTAARHKKKKKSVLNRLPDAWTEHVPWSRAKHAAKHACTALQFAASFLCGQLCSGVVIDKRGYRSRQLDTCLSVPCIWPGPWNWSCLHS